ncbi:MAG: PaaI family thioesterase [Solirubrobacteraceae bacterium]
MPDHLPRGPDELAFRLDQGFDRLFGLEVTEVGEDLMCGKVQVRDELKQPAGLVHGGVYAAVAESLATTGTALAVLAGGNTAMGMSNQTSFLRPITEGTINAQARVRHRGRTTWVWEVECRDDAGRLCVLTRVTVAVRTAPGGQPPTGAAPAAD